MRYKKFIIENYKAIEKVEIDVNKEIIPPIGINESGKTSILQGILAFDSSKDNLLEGVHIDVKNRYETKQKDCILQAQIILEDGAEFEEIGKAVKINMDDPIYEWLKNKYDCKSYITLQRDFKDGKLEKTYSIVNEELNVNEKKCKLLVKEIVKRLPNILYFDDFSDRVPPKVSFSRKYVNDQKLPRSKDREWQEIIQEIFSRAFEEEFSLINFMKLDDEDDRRNFLEDVKDVLDKEIITEWKNLKMDYSKIAEDEKYDLEIT